jgi:sporulation protein YlmC with PRC-barrel domain
MLISETTKFTMGSEVRCTDGVCGTLRRVVVDPVARSLTHLVVEPGHREREGRLVPIDLVSTAGAEIELSCALAEFETLEQAQELRFLPGARGQWGYRQEEMLSWPFHGLGPVVAGMDTGGMSRSQNANNEGRTTSYENTPTGEVQVRRGEHVHATDGPIGRVQGLVVDPADHRVTHVLLDEGHLWGLKQVAIPIGSVTGVDDGVRLELSKDQVRDLPPIELDDTE